MENSEIDKDLAAGDMTEKESVFSLAVTESKAIFNDQDSSTKGEVVNDIIKEGLEQAHHPERSGVSEWKADTTHLRDSVVYEVDESPSVAGTNKERLSFYEVTQQRDQSLYEKASCSSDVIRVWNQISHYIKSKLRQGSGVTLPGLGTFTTLVSKVSSPKDPRPDAFVLQRKPIFILSKILTRRYKVVDPTDQVCGFRVPASLLNLTEVGVKAKVSHGVVDGIVTEVIQTFARALVSGKAIEFPFPFIGKLRVQNRVCSMFFYAEYYRTMNYDLPERYPNAQSSSLASKAWLDKDERDDLDILPGRITPLNRHIPTESFRSVFHLREVRSVHDLVPVTEEDLASDPACLQLECIPPSPTEFITDYSDSDPPTAVSTKCVPVEADIVWCTENLGENSKPFPGEEIGESGGTMTNWFRQANSRYYRYEETSGEMAGEDEIQRPATPAPSLLSSEDEHVTPLQSPPTKTEEWEVEPGRPCRHNYRPAPLYKPCASGNYINDILLAQKVHYANALTSHHYTLCTKTLGVSNVKKHLTGAKVTGCETVRVNSPFYKF